MTSGKLFSAPLRCSHYIKKISIKLTNKPFIVYLLDVIMIQSFARVTTFLLTTIIQAR